jgi:two-component system nitrate/nitrite response regulator NarL
MTLVSLIDDHQLFSASLAVALRAEGFEVDTPQLSSLEALLAAILAQRPSVVMLDRDLGALGRGEDLIGPIARAGCSVMVVSATLDDVVVGRCLAAGAVACVLKNERFDVLLATIASVARGEYPVSPPERYRLIDTWRTWQASTDTTTDAFAQLTPREASVLGQLMDGQTVKSIAREGFVSEATVRTQVRGILTKLDVTSQLEAVVMALRTGWRPANPSADGVPAAGDRRSGLERRRVPPSRSS